MRYAPEVNKSHIYEVPRNNGLILHKGEVSEPWLHVNNCHDFNLSSCSALSFAAVIRVVTQCSSPTNGCSLKLCIPFPLLLRTNNMHVTVSSYTNHISRYICRQRSRFPRNGSLLLIGQFKERNAALE